MVISQQKVYDVAKSLLNVPYKHLGRTREEGFDCYGVVLEFFRLIGAPLRPYLPEYNKNWYMGSNLIEENAVDFEPIAIMRPACVVSAKTNNSFFPNHLMICVDGSYVLHTDEYAGTYMLRWFYIRDKIVRCYARIGLQVVNSM